MKNVLSRVRGLLFLFAFLLPGLASGKAAAEELICDPAWTAAYKCMQGCGPCGGGSSYSAPVYAPPARDYEAERRQQEADEAEAKRVRLLKEAHEANQSGVQLFGEHKWAEAVAAFREAARKDPNDAMIQKNLKEAKEQLASVKREDENRAAAGRMHESMESLSQSLAATSASGLDFDDGKGGKAANASLDFDSGRGPSVAKKPDAAQDPCGQTGSTMVVNACGVPSGLPKAVDNAIAGAYKDAPPGVSDRVRKGFQAVATSDWKAAKAWFEDALNHDPQNPDLKRLVSAIDETPEAKKQAAINRPNEATQKYTLETLRDNADKMSQEQIMGALDQILMDKVERDLLIEEAKSSLHRK